MVSGKHPHGDEADGGVSLVDADVTASDADNTQGDPNRSISDAAAGDAASNGMLESCEPNTDETRVDCPMRCPELCDGQDNDCDNAIDEDTVGRCDGPHSTGVCTAGQCFVVRCEAPYRDCNNDAADGCEVADDDADNCGLCGHKCSFVNGLAECRDDKCVRAGCGGAFADCDANPLDCETQTNTLGNCGGCGFSCGSLANALASCDLGYCAPGTCSVGYGDCNVVPGDGCEQPLTTLEHCGACGHACDLAGSQDDCSQGLCVAVSCETGYADCDGDPSNGCESLNSPERCGGCNDTCDADLPHVATAACADETCGIDTCEAGFGNCDSDPSNGCESSLTTAGACGGCNTPCAPAHAAASCASGTCTIDKCAAGYGDCNNDAADGCEQPLDTLTHCGACDTPCALAGCQGGQCSSSVCTAPRADCNGMPSDGPSSDGCEVDVSNDVNNCGACQNACAFTTGTPHATLNGCSAGACDISCTAGYADCNGDYRDGCERSLTTLTDCGACDVTCSISHATATCSTGSCRVAQCDQDYADCNNDATSCETSLNTASNCGACGSACNVSNAFAACGGSAGARSCTITACSQPYFMNCDGNTGTGCEVNTSNDVANCGACGSDCRAQSGVKSATCNSGLCAYTCNTGFGDCTVVPGCETPLTTLTDCGACGVACARTNANTSCASGSCQLTGCVGAFGDCNMNPVDGCETRTDTAQNCGSCGHSCNMPNATSTCNAGTCTLSMCNTNYADCNNDPSDGCERNISSPASGGQGPCQPEANCVKRSYGGHDYFFCSKVHSWTSARALCQLQASTDLVHIDDQAENDFIKSNLAVDSWTSANDRVVEGTWRWQDDSVQFWASGAGAIGGRFAAWDSAQPDDGGSNEDCAAVAASSGKWNDANCDASFGYVCEVQADQCPSDPNKTAPAQCGCGVPDTDTDLDGTADCNDDCPNDPYKVASGQCGCGVADLDGDVDGTPDCQDGCPTDANKQSAGSCGCGVPDTDTDSDGTADCHDACPYDGARQAAPCGFGYTPSNFDATSLTFAADVSVSCNVTLTSVNNTNAVSICGTSVIPVLQNQTNGPQLWILPMNNLVVGAGFTLKLNGTLPVVLAVAGNATVLGTIDASAAGSTVVGAGGDVSCSTGTGGGGGGTAFVCANGGPGGGGGGGFGSVGAKGGGGGGIAPGGAASTTEGNATLTPLRGGCAGGAGGQNVSAGGAPGHGGGAVQLSSAGLLTVGNAAVVAASGGGGNKNNGGGGGGSGGAVLLEGRTLSISASAWITANGGGGASGGGAVGSDGPKNSTAQAAGGGSGNGSGGKGAALAGAAASGSSGGGYCDAGGGGGGGFGRIRIHAALAGCTIPTAQVSPAASNSCP